MGTEPVQMSKESKAALVEGFIEMLSIVAFF